MSIRCPYFSSNETFQNVTYRRYNKRTLIMSTSFQCHIEKDIYVDVTSGSYISHIYKSKVTSIIIAKQNLCRLDIFPMIPLIDANNLTTNTTLFGEGCNHLEFPLACLCSVGHFIISQLQASLDPYPPPTDRPPTPHIFVCF